MKVALVINLFNISKEVKKLSDSVDWDSFFAGKPVEIPYELLGKLREYGGAATLAIYDKEEKIVEENSLLYDELVALDGIGEKTANYLVELCQNDKDKLIEMLQNDEVDLREDYLNILKEYFEIDEQS